jgi:hypothetical protein
VYAAFDFQTGAHHRFRAVGGVIGSKLLGENFAIAYDPDMDEKVRRYGLDDNVMKRRNKG